MDFESLSPAKVPRSVVMRIRGAIRTALRVAYSKRAAVLHDTQASGGVGFLEALVT
jgi:hypothetical protein